MAVVTLDAMHTQTHTATTIRAEGAHYVFTVKANNEHLHAQLKELGVEAGARTRHTR